MKKNSNDQSEEWAQKSLLALRNVPGRGPETENAGRVRFLSEAASLRRPTPAHSSYRQTFWVSFKSFVAGKQARLAFSAAAACIVMALLLVSGGSVVFAAQGSQPDQVLYPVKLLSEDVQLGLSANPQSQFQLNLQFANRRLDEIDKLTQAGKDPSDQVTGRLQNELNAALDSAASLDSSGSVKALENLQANLQQHENQLLKLQSQANPHAAANYARVVEMLQQKVSQAEQGIKDPQSIHNLNKQPKKQDKLLPGATFTPTSVGNSPTETAGAPSPMVTEPNNNVTHCNKSNNGNGNGNGNGNPCDQPETQVTSTPAQPPAVISTPKPKNPNQPVKTPKKNNHSNKGSNGPKK
jgi:hypothetical protein